MLLYQCSPRLIKSVPCQPGRYNIGSSSYRIVTYVSHADARACTHVHTHTHLNTRTCRNHNIHIYAVYTRTQIHTYMHRQTYTQAHIQSHTHARTHTLIIYFFPDTYFKYTCAHYSYTHTQKETGTEGQRGLERERDKKMNKSTNAPNTQ